MTITSRDRSTQAAPVALMLRMRRLLRRIPNRHWMCMAFVACVYLNLNARGAVSAGARLSTGYAFEFTRVLDAADTSTREAVHEAFVWPLLDLKWEAKPWQRWSIQLGGLAQFDARGRGDGPVGRWFGPTSTNVAVDTEDAPAVVSVPKPKTWQHALAFVNRFEFLDRRRAFRFWWGDQRLPIGRDEIWENYYDPSPSLLHPRSSVELNYGDTRRSARLFVDDGIEPSLVTTTWRLLPKSWSRRDRLHPLKISIHTLHATPQRQGVWSYHAGLLGGGWQMPVSFVLIPSVQVGYQSQGAWGGHAGAEVAWTWLGFLTRLRHMAIWGRNGPDGYRSTLLNLHSHPLFNQASGLQWRVPGGSVSTMSSVHRIDLSRGRLRLSGRVDLNAKSRYWGTGLVWEGESWALKYVLATQVFIDADTDSPFQRQHRMVAEAKVRLRPGLFLAQQVQWEGLSGSAADIIVWSGVEWRATTRASKGL